MRKSLPPEVLALIPNGVENLVLRCTICGGDLPASRRSIGDHAGACHRVRVLHRRYSIQLAKCIACLHPSTAAEREEFKAWRRDRGQLRRSGGRPRGSRTEQNAGSQDDAAPGKALDNGDGLSGTPDVALCGTKDDRKAQDVVSKNDAIRGSGANDLGQGEGLPLAVETEPCEATSRFDRD